jgi:hypothetical protein
MIGRTYMAKMIPDEIKGTGFYTPMDLAPEEYQKIKATPKIKPKTGKKKVTLSKAKKDAWDKGFSPFIRLRDALRTTGTLEDLICITCDARTPYRGSQASHFIEGRGNAVLFDEELVNGSCFACNIWKHGNMTQYTLRMIDLHGREWVDEKQQLRHVTKKYTVADYQEIERYYKERVKELLNAE